MVVKVVELVFVLVGHFAPAILFQLNENLICEVATPLQAVYLKVTEGGTKEMELYKWSTRHDCSAYARLLDREKEGKRETDNPPVLLLVQRIE